MGARAASMPKLATAPSLLAPFWLGRLDDRRLAQLAARGDERAFEVLYDRHHRALLGFCRHMLRSGDEAEDALQQTFLRAHRALVTHGAPTDPRPWLYTIARNHCRTLLSTRRYDLPVDAAAADGDGPGEQVEMRAELREVVADVERLPDNQRAALVLAELADLSHEQIASVIGVRPGKVKALIFQARSTLLAEREARETPCEQIREQLATAQGGALRRGPLRRHLRGCEPCRAYRIAVADQRRALALALPVTPSLGLKAAVLGSASAAGGAGAAAVGGASTVASLSGGFSAKVVAGAILIGGGAGGGAAIVHRADPAPRPAPVTVKEAAAAQPPAPALPSSPAAGVRAAPAAVAPAGEAAPKRAARRVRTRVSGANVATAGRCAGESGPGRRASPEDRKPKPAKAEKPPKAEAPPRATRPARVKEPKAKPAKPVKPAKKNQAAEPVVVAKPELPAQAQLPVKPPEPVKPDKRSGL